MKTTLPAILSLSVFLAACGGVKKTAETATPATPAAPAVAEETNLPPTPEVYQASEKRVNDLLHTKLEVKFDWAKAQLNGKATLELKPYFYPTSQLILDAKGFDIHKVALVNAGAQEPLKYEYDDAYLTIDLGKEFKRTETYKVYVEYTAKPNELPEGGSAAITSDKGLYFINPDGSEPNKMPQIWTQGETEASSCWFPTIDAPNERMTQELLITVKDKYKTLSNGTLVFSTDNGDGTRTDYWKQDLGHAPYLVMMAVGEFAMVKDTWRDSVEVNYYVEPEWEKYAKDIFGATPEMLEFFSTRLGVDYPWDKYSQIVVRDYVSGAMENTSAVIHGDFLYRNKRQLLDSDNESIIAHELFHHWFGDLVTCESWSNLPLNESFANYSQFLWDEYKYGRDQADHYALQEMNGYLGESRQKQVDLIRFNYHSREDMFDGHSYNKGGRILNMLRNYVGDDAFFLALEDYLNENKFGAAEVHHLRLAFEKVTGEDLNWFFNQWFLASGHPTLEIEQTYDATAAMQKVTIRQAQNFDNTPLYRLPIAVDVYVNGQVQRHEIVVDKYEETFEFPAASKPELVNVDGDKILLAIFKEKKSIEEYAYQYLHAPLYMDRYQALVQLQKSGDAVATETMLEAMNDRFWGLKLMVIRGLKKTQAAHPEKVKAGLLALTKDKNANVRAAALGALGRYGEGDASLVETFEKGLKDDSYSVMAASLGGISKVDGKAALKHAKALQDEEGVSIKNAVAGVYADNGTAEQNDWFIKTASSMSGFSSFDFLAKYSTYLQKQEDAEINKGLPVFENVARNGSVWWMKIPGYRALGDIEKMYKKRAGTAQTKLEAAEKEGDSSAVALLQREVSEAKAQEQKIKALIKEIKSGETNKQLDQYIGE